MTRRPCHTPAATGWPKPLTTHSAAVFGLILLLSACERREVDVSAVPDRAQATLGDPNHVVGECRALVTVINESVEKGSQPKSGGPASAELSRLATDMDDTIARVNRVKLTDARLKVLAARYSAMAGKISSAARDLAKAVEAFNPRRMKASEQSFQTALKLEEPLMTELDQYCQRRR